MLQLNILQIEHQYPQHLALFNIVRFMIFMRCLPYPPACFDPQEERMFIIGMRIVKIDSKLLKRTSCIR